PQLRPVRLGARPPILLPPHSRRSLMGRMPLPISAAIVLSLPCLAIAQSKIFSFHDERHQPSNSGSTVSAGGDVNGDGVGDFAVSVMTPFGSGRLGYVQVLSGRDGSALYTLLGEKLGDSFGISLDISGDVNGDGFADVIIGNTSFPDGDYVKVYSGRD